MAESDPSTFAVVFELGLIGIGLVLLWRLVIGPAARANRAPAALGRWVVSPGDFLLFILLVICGGIGFQIAAFRLLAHSSLDGDGRMIVAALMFQVGMLSGIAVFHFAISRDTSALPAAPLSALATGIATFLIALPLLAAVTIVWQGVLQFFGLPVEKQDLIDFFTNTHSNVLRGILVVFAVVVAPVTEELIFRRGLFRYLRGRVPRWLALTAPALLFGVLHVTWGTLDGLGALAPLAALGFIFSLAYERTGRIGTAIVAHALFNLNTVVLILSGVNV